MIVTGKKMIKILSRGPINEKHGIHGPINNPYAEELKIIFRMISSGHNVIEVLPDKTEVKLTVANFNLDNSVKEVPVITVTDNEVKKPEAPITTPEAPKPTNNNYNNNQSKFSNKFNNKNNNREQNQNTNVSTTPVVEEEKKDLLVNTPDIKGDSTKIQPDVVESK